MNILNKLTIKNLKLNKKRTIVTIIGIVLSVALICAVAGIVTSFQKTMVHQAISHDGNYHVSFENVKPEDIKYITQNKNTKSYFMTKELGYSRLEKVENLYKPYIYVMGFDKNALENSGLKLTKGRLPKNSNEIVIPDHLNYTNKSNIDVGDKITLNIGDRVLDNHKLNQSSPILEEDDEIIEEQITNTKPKEYTVVGIIERPSIEDYSAPGYTAISYLDNPEGELNVSVLCNKPSDFKNLIKEVNNVSDITKEGKYIYETNKDLLTWSGADLSDGNLTTLYSVAAIIISIIVISSIFVIKNSFSISITERIRQYGMFSSVGATSKQIKRNVLFEGVVLGLIGIPLGILLGLLAIFIVVALINLILGDYLNGLKFAFSVPLLPILIAILVGAITILISSLIPAIKASRISPIDAIRSSNDIKIKSKKLKTPKILKKFFNIGGEISYKNLKRSKKKYRTTVISIVVSVSIFIALYSFIEYGFKLSGIYYQELDYNFVVYEQQNDGKTTLKEFEKISKMDNVENYSIMKDATVRVDTKYFNQKFLDRFVNDAEDVVFVNVININSSLYNDYLKKLGLNNKNLNGKAILVDQTKIYEDEKYKDLKTTKLNVGDSINVVTDDDKNYELEIISIPDSGCMGTHNVGEPYLILSNETYSKVFGNDYFVNEIVIESKDPYALANSIDELKKNDKQFEGVSYINLKEEQKEQNAIVLVISIFLYGFILVITLIGITNIFNTITTNMLLRSKEFAMLKSIGMTRKEFNSMIRLESILYGMKSLLIGIPIGLVLSYLIYRSFGYSMETSYAIPWVAIIISILFVFVIVGITMKYSVNKISKQNIIETIRQDNI